MNLFPEEDAQNQLASTRETETVDASRPLAARMRPQNFDEFVGQSHLVRAGAPLRRAIEAGRAPSCLFFGPPGCGKTTLARLIARRSDAHFEDFSAVTGGVADVRRIVAAARERLKSAREGASIRTLLFVDEIHRFNRAQQDAFLPHVEDGTIILIGATTENPLASVNTPLLSRCRLYRLEPLNETDLLPLLQRALSDPRGLGERNLTAEDGALEHIARAAEGDARAALGALEMAADLTDESRVLTVTAVREAIGSRGADYDLHGDAHYQTISAYIKSLRGGDPDAAIFYMVRMLEGGEDPMFIARRLAIQAAEDIGLADPQALVVAMAALQCVEKIGLPEAAIPLAEATIYVASAPKSNTAYRALNRAREALQDQATPQVPSHLRPASLRGTRERLGDGVGYINPHDSEGNFVEQQYLPEGFSRGDFYEAGENGYESRIAARLRSWWNDG